MSGIERIGPSGPQGPARIEPSRTSGPSDAVFEVRSPRTNAAASGESKTRGAAERLRQTIVEGLDRGLDKSEILERVVSSGIQRGLGPLASPELERQVVRAIDENPAARELFDRLYTRAVQARG